MNNKLLVAPSPHVTKNMTTNMLMYAMIIALIPTAVSGVVVFGTRALIIMAISIGSAYIFEMLFRLIKDRKTVW